MHGECYFTYVGKAPEPTPEEKERIQEYIEEAQKTHVEQWEEMTGRKYSKTIKRINSVNEG